MEKQYDIFKIPKGNGKFRTIYAPKGEYKKALSDLVSNLARKMDKLDKNKCNFAFMNGKNCISNAEKHIGYNYTLSLDLSDFFDSVKIDMVKNILNKEELELCFIDGVARQGLSTSPSIANLAFLKCDDAIIRALKKQKIQAIYTRYADDLTFSFDLKEHTGKIINIVKQIVNRAGFKINYSKTKLQDARNGRIIITGVGVDREGVHPTRKILKKIRAATHQENSNSLQGLVEWSKCKKPKNKESKESDIKELLNLARKWGISLRKKDIKHIPYKESVELENNCVISGDPIDMLGMSTFTTGWTSCMSKTGCYRKGVPFWILLKGTRIAYQKSNKTISFGKIERHRMISRCLVHELRNGVLVYDKFYGNNTEVLENELKKFGVISIKEARKLYAGEKVVGNVVERYRPYFDSLKSGTGIRKNTTTRIRYAFV
jgi:hypothetical protein